MFDFNIVLISLTRSSSTSEHHFSGIDVSDGNTPEDKAENLVIKPIILGAQRDQLRNPDSRFILGDADNGSSLGEYVSSIEGLTTGDMERFLGQFWERPAIPEDWDVFVQSVDDTCHYGGRSDVILWEKAAGALRASPSAHNYPSQFMSGRQILGKRGIRVTQMPGFGCTFYLGEVFGKNAATVVPHDLAHLPAIWCFVCSTEFRNKVRKIDQALKVTNATFTKVPFNLEHWQKIAAEKYPHGLPKPFSSDPTQWLFNGHPEGSDDPLQVAVARLLGYRWPRQTGSNFPDCPALGNDGLEKYADGDGIVCISAIKGEEPAAERLRALLAAAYGSEWSAAKLTELLTQVGYSGKSLEDWLRNGFFEQHCALFHHRPFIWHIWDGRKDGFSALVNYHQLTKANLEKLTFSYLGDWISRQKAAVSAGEAGSDARLQAAKELQGELHRILEGEPPHDIFIRWKPWEQQPLGWDPDLNDGVRLNIRPFMNAKDVGKKGAGILRAKPNIHWKKDRGTDVVSAPWFKVFKGERINDHHLTLDEKRTARAAHTK